MLSSRSGTAVGTSISDFDSLKHACLRCILGSASTAFPSILTNQKPYSLAHINKFEPSLPHHLFTYLTPRLKFLIKSPVSVPSWTQISHSMLTSPCYAKPVISISDPFGISDAHLLMTWLFWLLLCWFNLALIIETPYFLLCHVSISISSNVSKILLPGLLSMIGTHPSNRFLLNCTGSLFKPALYLKFPNSHICYFLKTNLQT